MNKLLSALRKELRFIFPYDSHFWIQRIGDKKRVDEHIKGAHSHWFCPPSLCAVTLMLNFLEDYLSGFLLLCTSFFFLLSFHFKLFCRQLFSVHGLELSCSLPDFLPSFSAYQRTVWLSVQKQLYFLPESESCRRTLNSNRLCWDSAACLTLFACFVRRCVGDVWGQGCGPAPPLTS